jgi:hypothetical protein
MDKLINILKENKGKAVRVLIHNKYLNIISFGIIDECFYFEVGEEYNQTLTYNLLYLLECEASSGDWNNDIYRSPMERLSDCGLYITYNNIQYNCEVFIDNDKIILKALNEQLCPCCEETLDCEEYNGTYIYNHDTTCPFIGFEFVDNKDLNNFIDYINSRNN